MMILGVLESIKEPWHWSISGIMIVVIMALLIFSGQRFGVSSSFRAMCSAAGAGRWADYFNYDWRSHSWLLFFVVGSILGGVLASGPLDGARPIEISKQTVTDLAVVGIEAPTSDRGHAASLLPASLFSDGVDARTILLLVVGGVLIGFGTRWAGGCTSGHAISGLSNLQMPSLVAVIGFFAGGLLMTHLIFPYLF